MSAKKRKKAKPRARKAAPKRAPPKKAVRVVKKAKAVRRAPAKSGKAKKSAKTKRAAPSKPLPKKRPTAKVKRAAASKAVRRDVSAFVYRFQERLNDGSGQIAITRAYHAWYAAKERARRAIGQDAFRRVLVRIWEEYDFDLDEVDAYAES